MKSFKKEKKPCKVVISTFSPGISGRLQGWLSFESADMEALLGERKRPYLLKKNSWWQYE